MKQLIKDMEQSYDDLTKSHKQVAKYIVNHYEEVAFMTLEDVAGQIGVSTTTVIRFARNFGYAGFTAFQNQIQQLLKAKISLPERLNHAVHDKAHENLLTESFSQDLENIEKTLRTLDQKTLKEAIQAIIAAPVVYIIGRRSAFSVAHFFYSTLYQMRENVRLLHGLAGPQAEGDIISAPQGALCVAFSFSRYDRTTIEISSYMKKQGVQILAISDNQLSPMSELAEIHLICHVQGIMFKNSLAGPLALVNYLIAAVATQDHERAMRTLSKSEEITRSCGYFCI